MARKKPGHTAKKERTAVKNYLDNAEKIEKEIRAELAAEDAKVTEQEQEATEQAVEEEAPKPRIALLIISVMIIIACVAYFFWRANSGG